MVNIAAVHRNRNFFIRFADVLAFGGDFHQVALGGEDRLLGILLGHDENASQSRQVFAAVESDFAFGGFGNDFFVVGETVRRARATRA
jgi:hypothetical protein